MIVAIPRTTYYLLIQIYHSFTLYTGTNTKFQFTPDTNTDLPLTSPEHEHEY